MFWMKLILTRDPAKLSLPQKAGPALQRTFHQYAMYGKQKNLESVYSWSKMWSLKVLAILKCYNKTSVHAAQYQ